jgi:hypothetical protein
VSVAGAGLIGPVLDELFARFGAGSFQAEAVRARAEHDVRRGRVFEDEPLWETWTQGFLEWYVLERTLPGMDLPPAAQALGEESDPERAAVLRALLTSLRSLFVVRDLRPDRVELGDVLGGAALAVAVPRALFGVEPGDVMEARVVGFADDVHFARTFCYHPSGSGAIIARRVAALRAAGRDRRDILDTFARLRARCDHYRHVHPTRIYEQDTE